MIKEHKNNENKCSLFDTLRSKAVNDKKEKRERIRRTKIIMKEQNEEKYDDKSDKITRQIKRTRENRGEVYSKSGNSARREKSEKM